MGDNLQSCRHDQHELFIYSLVPTNGANPFTPADFDIDLPLRFTRAEVIWRDHLPFLPWADELVARGARPSYYTISFFEIESLLLEFVDMTALVLCAVRVMIIDAALSAAVDAVFRIMNFMRINNFVDSQCSSRAHFISIAHAAKLQLSPIDIAVFTIRASEVCNFESTRGAAYGGTMGWLQEWTWARAQGREGCFNTTIWILSLLGPRASMVSRSAPSRLTSIAYASRFGSAFIGAHTEFTFSSAEVASQLPGWVRTFKWPSELAIQPTDEEHWQAPAFSEFLRAYRFAQASPANKSMMVADVFDKVLAVLPSLASLAGEATPLQTYHAFRPLLKVFEISSDPLLSDWQTLDGRIIISSMLEIVVSMPPSAELLAQRVSMLLDDERATLRVHAGRAVSGSKADDGASGFKASIDPMKYEHHDSSSLGEASDSGGAASGGAGEG